MMSSTSAASFSTNVSESKKILTEAIDRHIMTIATFEAPIWCLAIFNCHATAVLELHWTAPRQPSRS